MTRFGVRVLLSCALLFPAVLHAADQTTAQAKSAKRSPRLELAGAPPAQQTIAGNPLTVIVGADQSYQVINATFPTTGQIYPGSCLTSVADAGIFAHVNGTYFSPDLADHTCGSAGNPSLTPWTPVSISPVTGTGTAASPFSVTVVSDAGATGVRLTAVYTYVNGESFFRINKTFCATGAAATLQIFHGADIYLAGNDSGIPYLEPASNSPGGRDCPGSGYTILLVPTTPANAYAANGYSSVWDQIEAGALSNTVSTGCIDNGAALQWTRNVAAGACVAVSSAVSFGAIPPIAQFRVDAVNPAQGQQGQTLNVVVSGIGFQAGTTFDFGPGITVTATTINSPTQATVTLVIAPTATIGFRNVTGTQSPGGLTSTAVNAFEVVAGGTPTTADVRITKSANPTQTNIGGNIAFTIVVTNGGPASATGVVVTDTLPANVSYVTSTATQGTCTPAGNVVTCSVGTLANGASATITINTQANAPGAANNTATVATGSTDPNAANNASTVGVTIGGVAATAVPTLDVWAFILMAMMLGAAGIFVSMRR